MLMIGAVLGRLIGLATVDVFEALGYSEIFSNDPTNPWRWIDPGAFALVGAGASCAGAEKLLVCIGSIVSLFFGRAPNPTCPALARPLVGLGSVTNSFYALSSWAV